MSIFKRFNILYNISMIRLYCVQISVKNVIVREIHDHSHNLTREETVIVSDDVD